MERTRSILLDEARESLEFVGLSWKKPRSIENYIAACIQEQAFIGTIYDRRFYSGLLNPTEKSRLADEIEESNRARKEENPNPWQRVERRFPVWQRYKVAQGMGSAGWLYGSSGYFREGGREEWKREKARSARVSFSINEARASEFFDTVMYELSKGSLSATPLLFKMDSYGQGSGEDAHLYFTPKNEETVYKALTEEIYPRLEALGLTAIGGRFPMIPVVGANGRVLPGVDFGQGMFDRPELGSHLRDEMMSRSENAELATSRVINMVLWQTARSGDFQRRLPDLVAMFKAGGLGPKLNAAIDQIAEPALQYFASIGRDPHYPIIDRDARTLFPHFTKLLPTSA